MDDPATTHLRRIGRFEKSLQHRALATLRRRLNKTT
jgi:hypothetical protein